LAPLGAFEKGVRIGVPIPGQRVFFGDQLSAAAYEAALAQAAALGATIVEIDIEPFYEAQRLLYDGPWLAERYLAVRSMLASSPDAILPVTREIILQGARWTAVDFFSALYTLEQLRRVRDFVFTQIDALLLPTIPTVYTVDQVLADPIQLNGRLGLYTNFVNLLDLCGLAVPSAMRTDGVPFGITLLAPGGHDALLASLGRALHAETSLPLGALKVPQAPLAPLAATAGDGIALAVVGAHLSGMPLNGELKALGARLVETAATVPDYRLYALAGGEVAKPGLLRVGKEEGVPIEIEVWSLSAEAFGRFVAAIPPPLSIGTLRLADGRGVKGFLVEAEAVAGARDISSFGGWRAYVARAKTSAA
jgi:allophanate hydrolase